MSLINITRVTGQKSSEGDSINPHVLGWSYGILIAEDIGNLGTVTVSVINTL